MTDYKSSNNFNNQHLPIESYNALFRIGDAEEKKTHRLNIYQLTKVVEQ